MLRIMKRLIALILLMLILLYSPAIAMSYNDERKIASELITVLEANGLIIHDPEITWTLQSLADQLADHISNPVYTFNLHLINDRSINAFAIPDGHIFINLGTLLMIHDIDELAGVIGHEMGHCQLRHIPQAYDAQKKISTASLIGVIIGTLISTQNPQIGTALLYSSLGGAENIKLQYSRKHEYEGDEFSRNILKRSNFDPSGMNRFLIRLRTFAGTSTLPEYFLSHPYAQQRIAALQSAPTDTRPDTRYWSLYASVVGLLLSEREAMVYIHRMPDPFDKLASGLLMVRLGRNKQALDLLEDIDLPQARAYRGLALYHQGFEDKAYPLLKGYTRSADVNLALAEILMKQGKADEAIIALVPFEKQNQRAAYMLGNLYEKAENIPRAHISYARYFFSTGNLKASQYHIDKALFYEKDLDQKLIEELKQMQKIIKKAQQA